MATSAAEQEFAKLFAMSMALVTLQFILNMFGFYGLTVAAAMYVLANVVSLMLVVDRKGFRASRVGSPSDYMVCAALDILVVLLGFFMWFFISIWAGVDSTVSSLRHPDQAFARQGFLMKILFAEISHLTMFSTCQIFVNLYSATNAWWNGK